MPSPSGQAAVPLLNTRYMYVAYLAALGLAVGLAVGRKLGLAVGLVDGLVVGVEDGLAVGPRFHTFGGAREGVRD